MAFSTAKPACQKLESRPGCIQAALQIIGDKWSPLLLGQLLDGDKTFGELETQLAGISPRTLSNRLDKLQLEGVISKERYCAHPPRFRYHLTEKGMGLQEILSKMAEWGETYSS